jgi:uncharacterized membrane protein YeaQ/YmgE (transglycosylase-associated protein family)
MFEFMWWLIVGLAAGLVARFILPGKQPMGLFGTLLLGLLGSLIGGAISAAIYGFNPMEPGFHPAGLVMASVGALILLASFVTYSRRSSRLTKPVL